MSVTITTGKLKIKDGNNGYIAMDAVANNSIADMQEAVTNCITEVNNAAAAAVDTIPSGIVALNDEVDELKSAFDLMEDEINLASDRIPITNITTISATLGPTTMKVIAQSTARSVYIDVGDSKIITVSKTAGKRFMVAFSTDIPAYNVSVVGLVEDNTGNKITVEVPDGAKYLIAYVWNGGLDTTITAEDMIASVSIVGVSSAKDSVARDDIAKVAGAFDVIYPQNYAPYTQLTAANPYITPEIFGAYGDGDHDDTTALQSAINLGATMGVPVMLSKIYAITNTVNVSGILTGFGTVRLLDQDTRLSGCLLTTTGDTNIYGITIDCKSNVTFTVDDKFVDYNIGLVHSVAGQLVVDGCTFRNIYTAFIAIRSNTKKNVQIRNNYFDASNKSNRFMSRCVSVASFIQADSVVSIQNNSFQGYVGEDDTLDNASAITSSNCRIKRFIITNNTMQNMGRLATYDGQVGFSRLCAIDFYFNSENIIISDNKILACNWVPIRLHGVSNVKITGNEIGIAKYINEPMIWISDAQNSTGEAPVGVSNIIVDSNVIAPITNKHCSAVIQINSIPRHASAESSITDVIVRNNTIKNLYSEQVILFDDSVKSCEITDNTIMRDDTTVAGAVVNGIYFREGTYSNTRIKISNNDFNLEIGNCINMIDADGIDAEISSNRLHADAGACIFGNANASITAINNIMSGSEGINSITTAIRNISNCLTNYTGIGNEYENFPTE